MADIKLRDATALQTVIDKNAALADGEEDVDLPVAGRASREIGYPHVHAQVGGR